MSKAFGQIHEYTKSPGALPYVGGYQVPVIRPPFYADLRPNDPFLFSPHPMALFFHFCSIFYIQIANFQMFCARFEIEVSHCIFAQRMTPILAVFWESTTKKIPFSWCLHEMTTFFDEIFHRMPPSFDLR